MDMRDHALSLAAMGFRVVPLHWPILDTTIDGIPLCSCGKQDCTSVGKHPLTAHGVKDATCYSDYVRRWWAEYPQANIGIATGFDHDVIDIDGPEGLDAFQQFVTMFGMPLIVGMVTTGREGGKHFYTSTGGQQNWTGGFGGYPAHLDCKGRGGYVVAPPSMHASGRRYEWQIQPTAEKLTVGAVPWVQWHADVKQYVTRELHPSQVSGSIPGDALIIRQPGGHHGGNFADVVRERVLSDVRSAGEGSRWQTFAMVGIWVCAGLIHGNEIGYGEALSLLEELAREIGLSQSEVNRVPRELDRAVSKRLAPIQSRGAQVPAAVSGVTGLPAESAQALSVDSGGLFSEAAELERQTNAARIRIKANDAARRQIAQEEAGKRKFSSRITLAELMALPEQDVKYRVDRLWPVGGRAMLAAQFKAGKTTMVGNVVRCLADSGRFLSRYQGNAPDGCVALFDTEMSTAMLKTWLSAQGIENTEKVSVFPMRGFLSGFDLTDEMVRAHWAQELKEADATVLILDCLGPIMAACGLDESVNKDVGTFINAFESLLAEADIAESMIVHHMGHAGERSRGASRLRDWPDVEWHLIREGQEDEITPAPDVPRYFRAYGRDVSEAEQLLHYEPEMRWLSVNGEGNRKQVKLNTVAAKVLSHVIKCPGETGRGIIESVGGRQVSVREAIKSLVDAGTLVAVPGERRAIQYFHCEYQG